MDINTTNWFFERIQNDNLCLLYNGYFSDEITYKMIDLSEYNISNFEELSKMRKKVSFLMAECFQNIIRHREKPGEVESDVDHRGFFMTRNRKDAYYISSGNLIEKKNIPELTNQLEKVNSLDKDELKAFYLEALNTEGFTTKGGAGLGLIEMARKSGQKLSYAFEDYDNIYSYFYNQISLKLSPEASEEKSQIEVPLSMATGFHKRMVDKNIIVIQKGDFSNDSILPVLNIIDKNLHERTKKSYPKKKKIYHILVELLQNISRHCLKINGIREGIFAIGRTDDGFIINTGNFVHKDKIAPLKEMLDHLNSLSDQQLVNLYVRKLKEGAAARTGGAGIGLIDIARRTDGELTYSIHEMDNKFFFALSVTV